MIGIDKPSIEALDLSEDGTYGKFVMEPDVYKRQVAALAEGAREGGLNF